MIDPCTHCPWKKENSSAFVNFPDIYNHLQSIKNLEFTKELKSLINRYNFESISNTPDSLLADYLINCLINYNDICKKRDKFYGIRHFVGNVCQERKK